MEGLLMGGAGLFTIIITIVAVAIPCLLTVGIFAGVIIWQRNQQKKAMNLAQNGIQGTATIMGLADTGMRMNDNPRVQLQMQIELPGQPPYTVNKTVTIPLIRLSQVQVGQQVVVFVDPADPTNPDKIALGLR